MTMIMTPEQIIENKKLEDHRKKNKKYLKEHGWTVYYGWDKYCPYAEYIYEDCGRGTGWERARAFPWQDHTRRLKKKDEEGNTQTIYVTEPYHFRNNDFTDIHVLIEDGWKVVLTNSHDLSLHYPGKTIPIWITRDVNIRIPSGRT